MPCIVSPLVNADKLKAPGTIVRAKVVDAQSPIAYGYPDSFSVYTADGPIFGLTNIAGAPARGRSDRRRAQIPPETSSLRTSAARGGIFRHKARRSASGVPWGRPPRPATSPWRRRSPRARPYG